MKANITGVPKGALSGTRIQNISIVLLLIASALLLPIMQHAAFAENANDTIIVNVNISQTAAIEVLPVAITWNQLATGSNGSVINVSVKNIGSLNLTKFYININTENVETQNPVATGNITHYAAGGFILFRNESAGLTYFHLGRLEWNLTEVMDTEKLNLGAGVKKYGHGWYRKADGNEFLWKLENGTQPLNGSAWCNNTDTKFIIKKSPENASGYNRDLSTNIATATADAKNANWTFFHFTGAQGGPLQGQCVAAYYDCSRIYIYKYDMTGASANNFGDCDSAAYLTTSKLEPGERLDKLKIKPSIPQGTPAGDSMQSILTFFASVA